jgi:hypothetical protein
MATLYLRQSCRSIRVKEWRKSHPGYWRKKKSACEEPSEAADALQEVLLMQPAVMVGLISMMTGSALQEDIAVTTRALLCKGRDILGMRLWTHNEVSSR